MKVAKWLQDAIRADREHIDYLVENDIIDFTEQVAAQMKKAGISKAELAKRLGNSRSYVTQLLAGQNNFTLKTMRSIAKELGCDFKVSLLESAPKYNFLVDLQYVHAMHQAHHIAWQKASVAISCKKKGEQEICYVQGRTISKEDVYKEVSYDQDYALSA